MKVIVESNIRILGVFEPPTEVELKGSNATLGDLLKELTALCKTIEFFSLEEGDMGGDVEEIVVNGERCYLPEHLTTTLNEGDRIMIRVLLAPLGGG